MLGQYVINKLFKIQICGFQALEISDCAIERVRGIIFFMLTPILLYLDWKHFSLADYPYVDM